jgi:NTE family protein
MSAHPAAELRVDTSPDGMAVPRDMTAGHGDGLPLGVCLGGGGLWFVAWQVTYLHELLAAGVDLRGADRVVGTSAGSIVSAVLEAGNIKRLHGELGVLARLPKLVGVLAPASRSTPSQDRARDLFWVAQDSEPATIRAIGHAALAAQTPSPVTMRRNLAVVLAARRWPSPALHLTAVDAFSGERLVITARHGISVPRATAASSAVPGIFPPQPLHDRRAMDGGVSGTGLHLDLLAGARRAVVIQLTDGADATQGAMTQRPGDPIAELEALESSGTKVFHRMPESVDLERLMEPTAVPSAIAMARRQARDDADELRMFLA